MKLPLAYYGDPILRKTCESVVIINDDIRRLVHDMVDTVIEHKGLGLSAPQVHHNLKIFIMTIGKELPNGSWLPGKLKIFINPEILSVSDKLEYRSEGCLSIPKVYGDVERAISVKIRAQDLDGDLFEEEFSGLEARCILHENDHINGILFVDHIKGKARKKIEPLLREIEKKNSA